MQERDSSDRVLFFCVIPGNSIVKVQVICYNSATYNSSRCMEILEFKAVQPTISMIKEIVSY